MNSIHDKFLTLLRCALTGETASELAATTAEEWQQLFQMAGIHHVMPLIYEAAFRIPEVKSAGLPVMVMAKQQIFQQVFQQVRKTSEFLQLYAHLQRAGITPLVSKGIICRNLYPQPDHRPSGDEDVLIPPEQFEQCHRALLDFGMVTAEPEENLSTAYEVPYGKPGSPLYIELHKHLFPPEAEAYGDWNRFFEGVFDRAIEEPVYGTGVRTMEYTDHFFYLICHSFKHFLHGGFGIRQVCDIVLYANKYGEKIDWNRLMELCREIRGVKFTAALLKIGGKHLVFDPDGACYPGFWRDIDVDESHMLEDLLDSGVFGHSTMSRKHSSNITLDAMTAQNQGKKAKTSVLGALFPGAQKLENRFPYLKKHPWLLPVAWVQRIVKYGKETRNSADNNAADAMRIGSQRIDLMREYDIIE